MTLRQRDGAVPGSRRDRRTGTTGAPEAPAAPLRVPGQAPGAHDALPLTRPQASGPATGPVPESAEWTAPHRGRLVSAGLLLVALAGTAGLGVRFYRDGTAEDLTALVVGLAVVVVLWGLTVMAAPHVVTVRGSVLRVFVGREEERFVLDDLAQEVDLVGTPDSPDWALLLHRRDGSARVLRRTDVDPVVVDAVVRHHRDRASQRAADRERRFTL